MTTKLAREKQKRQSWQREYHNLRGFMLKVMEAAASRDVGYLRRKHGDVINQHCADRIVHLCQDFNEDQYAALVDRLYEQAERNAALERSSEEKP